MTAFDERRDQFEKKYAHDEELLFKARSRRNRLFGLMIAGRLGKREEEAADYARRFVMAAALAPSGDEGIVKLAGIDLEAAGLPPSAGELMRMLLELQDRAMQEIRTE